MSADYALLPQRGISQLINTFLSLQYLQQITRQQFQILFPTNRPSSTSTSPRREHKNPTKIEIEKCIEIRNPNLLLADFQLQTIPFQLVECSFLVSLNLSHNQLSTIPTWFCDVFKTHLKILNLSHNQICELPQDFSKLFLLKELYLNHNHIEFFPEAILTTFKSHLQIIHLHNNELINLPSNITRLKELKELSVSENALLNFPAEAVFGECTNLETIALEGNNFLFSEIEDVEKRFDEYNRSKMKKSTVVEQMRRTREFLEQQSIQQQQQPPNFDSPTLLLDNVMTVVEQQEVESGVRIEHVRTMTDLLLEQEMALLENAAAAITNAQSDSTQVNTPNGKRRTSMKDALDSVRKKKQKQSQDLRNKYNERIKVLVEILDSERRYVSYLNVLHDLYYLPLTSGTAQYNTAKDMKKIKLKHVLPLEVTHKIFPRDLSVIIKISKWLLEQLSKSLEDQISLSNTTNSTSELVYHIQFGPIFCKLAPYFKSYLTYIMDYESAANSVKQFQTTYPSFKTFMEDKRNSVEAKGQDLNSLLLMAIQRIPRYRLLLQNLLNKTPPGHPDRLPLEEAVKKICEAANFHNQQIDKINKRITITKLASLIPCSKRVSNRHFVSDWKTTILERRGESFYLYLFNDILIIHPTSIAPVLPNTNSHANNTMNNNSNRKRMSATLLMSPLTSASFATSSSTTGDALLDLPTPSSPVVIKSKRRSLNMLLESTLSTFSYLNPFSQYFKIKTCKITSVENTTVVIKILDTTVSTKKKEDAMQLFTLQFASTNEAKKFANDLEKTIQNSNRFINGAANNLKRMFSSSSNNFTQKNE